MGIGDRNSASGIALPPGLRWFLIVSALMSIASTVYLVVQVKYAPGFHHGLPYDIYTRSLFEDLNAFVWKIKIVHTPEFFTTEWRYLYPAPCVLLYYFFSLFNHFSSNHQYRGAELALCAIVLACLIELGRRLASALKRRGLNYRQAIVFVFGSALCSWPIFYGVHQGNIECVLWVGVAAALWAYYREKWWTAAVLLGTFGSFKLYPMLLLALFLAPRKYAQIALGLLLFGSITLASLAFIGPSIPVAYQHVSAGIHSYSALGLSLNGVMPSGGNMFDHSLPGLLHFALRSHFPKILQYVLKYYMAALAVITTVVFFTRVQKMPRANQVLFIVLATVFIPPISFDYTLQMLYIPWAWLAMIGVSAATRNREIDGLAPVMICLALVCAPELFIKHHGIYVYGEFKAIVIIALFYLTSRYRFFEIEDVVPSIVE